VKIQVYDVNDFEKHADPKLIKEVEGVVAAMPLLVKYSDQANRQDRLIFSPVATNIAIGEELVARKWGKQIVIPKAYQALGKDVDFGKDGLLVEVQLSNYPFFLNNVVRTNVLYNEGVDLPGMGKIRAAVVITKGKLFEASNSTLYYEQAVNQIEFMVRGNSVQVPLRIIGLTAERGKPEAACVVEYHAKRYSRTIVKRTNVVCQIGGNGAVRQRERIVIVPQDGKLKKLKGK